MRGTAIARLRAPFPPGAVSPFMNSNLSNAVQALPAVVYFIAWIVCLLLAISWLVLPWTISGRLSAILRIQERQLKELERLNHKE
jgi:hypothetical protein